ncbi:MAG: tetraacyldisaccharide 4'-kinase [Acidisphaera sp.]|nr:tetraacyldisaccharide 4'-kinase [Acidisphaera sp.]
MRPPGFWQAGADDTLLAPLLTPLGAITAGVTARRVARPGWRAPVPVLCCGNVSLGGAGKTTLALDLARRLVARGVAVHLLSRGYGGRLRGPLCVDPALHDAAAVGDEPLLLASVAPTWIGADRAAAARAAVAAGAAALVLDDGLQNPTLAKDLSLLVIDGDAGFGNGRLLPAGPLREPVAAGATRCAAAVLIGEDRSGALRVLPAALPVLRARLVQGPEAAALRGRPVVAFAGIARPQKFFAGLAQAGVDPVARFAFPDHHAYRETELRRVLAEAVRRDAAVVTTPKDAVRLPPNLRDAVRVVGVALRWADAGAVEALLDEWLA